MLSLSVFFFYFLLTSIQLLSVVAISFLHCFGRFYAANINWQHVQNDKAMHTIHICHLLFITISASDQNQFDRVRIVYDWARHKIIGNKNERKKTHTHQNYGIGLLAVEKTTKNEKKKLELNCIGNCVFVFCNERNWKIKPKKKQQPTYQNGKFSQFVWPCIFKCNNQINELRWIESNVTII